jgi:hypothetical protein
VITPRRIVITVLLAGALFGFFYAFTIGEEPKELASEAVEQLIPAPDDVVLQQNEVGVDLEPGWLATLTVNGVRIPEDQVNCRDECPVEDVGVDPQNRFVFTPGAGREIEELPSGRVCAGARVWRVAETEADGENVIWCFRVGA